MKDNGHLSPSQRALGVEIPSVIALDYTGLNQCCHRALCIAGDRLSVRKAVQIRGRGVIDAVAGTVQRSLGRTMASSRVREAEGLNLPSLPPCAIPSALAEEMAWA